MNRRILVVLLAAMALLEGCQSAQASSPSSFPDTSATALARASWTPIPVIAMVNSPVPTQTYTPTVTPIPTATPIPTETFTPTPGPTATLVPSPTLPPPTVVPTNTRHPTVTLQPTMARTTINTAIPGPFGGDTATWTPPAPTGPQFKDHLVFWRPIGEDHVNYWARNYSYGSTDGGTRPVHHGVDIMNETGTPVLAAADGVVYYADADKAVIFGPQPDFYGNVIVIQHDFQDADGQPIYTLYGHLSKIEVSKGQKVKLGQEIGLVGSTGVAVGSHVHFEVRAGKPTDYNATRNPELWILPYLGAGILTGRVMDLNGNLLPGIEVEVQSAEIYRFGYSYADENVNGDMVMGENFAIPDLPSGYYYVFVKLPDSGLRFKTLTYIRAGRTNWIDIHLSLNP